MSRTFVYARVSKDEQTTDNQLLEIEAAGFAVQPRRIVVEQISGGVAAAARPGFSKLIDRLEQDDILIVTKLDRLGRNAMDIRSTVERLAKEGVRVYCLALGGMDLNSSTGKLTMGVIAAFAEFERDQMIERTNAGLARTVAKGTKLGRREALSDKQKGEVRELLAAGVPVAKIARDYSTSRQTIIRQRTQMSSSDK
ncbi:Site-specific recombinase (plasmid) [Pseudomonas fluorescens R124]|uniref:Site-specific recombinase n=1 Tax=Pseudomonas fluorescens R124 TaxID=743713 RepID=K0WMU6_PSEFL|nr:recombinase family protein [Pseudomonas fluorescens]AFS51678.1 site-specific recombinase [Pseudomonas fluorescens R124]EJZ60923.1 Site-specific recombinase [Pseudomonas fluorescens R124]